MEKIRWKGKRRKRGEERIENVKWNLERKYNFWKKGGGRIFNLSKIIPLLNYLSEDILSSAAWRPDAKPTGCSAIVVDLKNQPIIPRSHRRTFWIYKTNRLFGYRPYLKNRLMNDSTKPTINLISSSAWVLKVIH